MEPSEEFCLSGCTCSFSLGTGSVVEEKVKKGVKQQKKEEKDKKRKNKQRQQQLQLQQKPWTGVWERATEKKNSRPQLPTFLSFPPLHLLCFFFRLFSFAAGAWAHTSKVLNRTWCCNHLYQQGIEEIL